MSANGNLLRSLINYTHFFICTNISVLSPGVSAISLANYQSKNLKPEIEFAVFTLHFVYKKIWHVKRLVNYLTLILGGAQT